MTQTTPLTQSQALRVKGALHLLKQRAPSHYNHFMRAIQSVEYAPGAAGPRGLACTGGPYGRRLILAQDPERMSIVDLAVTLSHEARHHQVAHNGAWQVVPHNSLPVGAQARHAYGVMNEDAATGLTISPAIAFVGGVVVGVLGTLLFEGKIKMSGTD